MTPRFLAVSASRIGLPSSITGSIFSVLMPDKHVSLPNNISCVFFGFSFSPFSFAQAEIAAMSAFNSRMAPKSSLRVLPVVPHASRAATVQNSIKFPPLWSLFKIFKLTKNMRANADESEFADFLLKVGNGEYPSNEENLIDLPPSIICDTRYCQ